MQGSKDNQLTIRDGVLVSCDSSVAGSINIPPGVTSIAPWVFRGCSGLTSVEIPSGVTIIGYYAFSHCNSLTSVEIPSGVTEIGSYAFSGCSSLTSVEIPSGVTRIGYHAFAHCSSLTSVEIPSGVLSIGEEAFIGCSNLKAASITINTSDMNLREYIGYGSNLLINRVTSGLALEVKFNLMVREASTKLIAGFVNPKLREQLIVYLLCLRRFCQQEELPELPWFTVPLIFNSTRVAKHVCVDEDGLLKKERKEESDMYIGYGR